MKKRLAVIFAAVMASVLTIGLLSGCSKEPFILYPSYVQNVSMMEPLKDSFLYAEENRINIVYPNEDYDPNDPNSERYFYDPNLPSSRVVLLTEQAQLEEAFETVPEIDLDTTMVLVVLFSLSGNSGAGLQDIKVENGVLEVIIKKSQGSMATEPFLRTFVIEMDKMEITDTKVTIIKE